jgi:putative membrane protein
MRRRTLTWLTLCAVLAAQAAGAAQESKKDPVDPTPPPLGTASFTPPPAVEGEPLTSNTFVIRAALVHMTEIELGQLAMARSSDPRVQDFARKMVDEHQKSLAQLRATAASAKVALPGALDQRHAELRKSLASLQGKEFDTAYAKAMAMGHDEAVALFDAASSSDNLMPSLQKYARDALPVVRKHRDAAHELHALYASEAR